MRAISNRPAIYFTSLLIILFLAPVAHANWIGGIEFDHPSPSYLPHGEFVGVTIDCKVTEPGGVLLWALPYTAGSITPGLTYTGGPVIPPGTATVTRFFRIGTGEQTVDHVKFNMRTADNSATVMEFFVRVKYVYGPYGIYNIQFSEAEHSVLANGDGLTVTCDYATPGPDDVLVFARPYTGGSLSSGYAASAGDPGPASGSASQQFTFPTADSDVDQVWISIWNAANTENLFEILQNVDFCWRDVGVTNIAFSRPIPSMVHHEDTVDITFDYQNPLAGNLRIWFHPYEDGSYAAGGLFQGSAPVPPGSGSQARYIGSSGSTHVNQAHLLVTDEDQTVTYVDRLIPVDFTFAPHVVTDVVVTPEPPALLDYTELVHLDFNYRTDHPENILIHAYPRAGDAGIPDSHTHGSAIYAPPTGTGDYEFFLGTGADPPVVDQIQFAFYSYPEIDFLGDWWTDTTYLWGIAGTVMPVPGPVPGHLVQLGPNYPNPFNPATTIPVTLAGTRHVRLAVYDLRGRLVRVLADELMGPGRHEIPFDGKGLASGPYHYRLEGSGTPQTGSMMLVK